MSVVGGGGDDEDPLLTDWPDDWTAGMSTAESWPDPSISWRGIGASS